MQTENTPNTQAQSQDTAEPEGSRFGTFAAVALVTLLILGGLGIAVVALSNNNLPMGYAGFEENKK